MNIGHALRGLPATFTSPNCLGPWLWTFGDGGTSTAQNPGYSFISFGTYDVTLTVTDVNGNVSTCTATVTVQDNVPPVAVCQDVTVQLDAAGNGSVTAAQVNNGSSDACGIGTRQQRPHRQRPSLPSCFRG